MIRRLSRRVLATLIADCEPAERRMALVMRLVAAGTFALVLATAPLWRTGQPVPRVPWVALLAAIYDGLDAVFFPVLLVALAAATVAPNETARRGALVISWVALAALVAGDQHRLQPWAYQYLLWGAVALTAAPARGVALLRLLTVSIYVYSGWSKLDASFAETLGPQIVEALAGLGGISIAGWSAEARGAAALALPLGELLVAAALCTPWRWTGVGLAAIMHLLTIAALSPWGLNHRPAVLVWNAVFLAQVAVLFWPRAPESTASAPVRRRAWIAELVTAWAIVWPLAEPWGWCDQWPAWGLYATRAGRVRMFVREEDVPFLPPTFRDCLGPPDGEGWRAVRLDAWSLDVFRSPIYPQLRFQLGIAQAVLEEGRLRRPAMIVAEGPAARLTGRRDEVTLWSDAEIRAYARRYLFNSSPQWRPASDNVAAGR